MSHTFFQGQRHQHGFIDLEPPEDSLVTPPSTLDGPRLTIAAPSLEVYADGALVRFANCRVGLSGRSDRSLVWLVHASKDQRDCPLVAETIACANWQKVVQREVARGE